MALIDITPREADALFDRLDSWYRGQPTPEAGGDERTKAETHGEAGR